MARSDQTRITVLACLSLGECSMKFGNEYVALSTVREAYAEADRDDAIIMVRHGIDADEWIAVVVPAECLGDYDAEAHWIDAAGDWVHPYRLPVIVLHDPRSNYPAGCSTNSHLSGAIVTAGLNRHDDCFHTLTAELIRIQKGN